MIPAAPGGVRHTVVTVNSKHVVSHPLSSQNSDSDSGRLACNFVGDAGLRCESVAAGVYVSDSDAH